MPKINFPETDFADLELDSGTALSQALTATNSPILFGCRTGICGTCLCKVNDLSGRGLPASSDDEKEVLDLIAGSEPNARLACQIQLDRDMELYKLLEDA